MKIENASCQLNRLYLCTACQLEPCTKSRSPGLLIKFYCYQKKKKNQSGFLWNNFWNVFVATKAYDTVRTVSVFSFSSFHEWCVGLFCGLGGLLRD